MLLNKRLATSTASSGTTVPRQHALLNQLLVPPTRLVVTRPRIIQQLRVAAPEATPVVEGPRGLPEDARQQLEQQMERQQSQETQQELSARVPWWNKPVKGAEYLKEINNVQELQDAFSQSKADGKSVAIDFFAGNCPSCKAAYPKLCSIAKDPKLRETFNFYKANVQDPTLFWWIKRNSVTTIPFFLVYSPQGAQVLGTTASFKRMPVIKEGMYTIRANPQAKKFAMNPEKTKIEMVQ
uniref:Thioredoxin domain-containing protein n=1 Tax=Dunaliella tertiolecta TaxID=3047 RepID=A0A7S3QK25_DUNTE|mmetsp:Transcript_7994/g.21299  ORF Transcript_7994/g.21299 Transcript_7994/m.21299 type:complete len:239 (-) Transcript_7994:517-1233(-)|eukprot:CAMPEP_0202355676 /NCGR_PEP_ID=MMETSP1126-20121109/10467_1 /ASSEMBLY_ACC=CAM_ASM_000457 /TAXON_ID=3047 /ORGANISM="Dunaliella tertiolecta, Strain CCMP1320" /LENGTH=238 /DNA_ID=CAMNT_0048948323 /DNA_START=39 /DNA_END=755 /DNA_ORIENTATION=+